MVKTLALVRERNAQLGVELDRISKEGDLKDEKYQQNLESLEKENDEALKQLDFLKTNKEEKLKNVEKDLELAHQDQKKLEVKLFKSILVQT